ncbi:oxygenase MpaB family protein [Mycetocola zhadangensis]|uniref:oxygenase MpaB family protein n=1 Tax=Mycetocola zhadangensis TaxID=1164595 RepID=UPI003A4D295A
MTSLTNTWRSHLLSTLSGNSDGHPAWVDRLEEGDDAGFFGPGSAAWVVHGELPTLVAGIRSLLLQALHPGALAGVHDWSRYREDPLGRLTGTIQWLMTVTFADTATAVSESHRVGRFHERVRGTYVDAAGQTRHYSAGDQELLAWVHNVFTDSFLACHLLWGSPIPGGPDAYVREWTQAGKLVGVEHPPQSATELRQELHSALSTGTLKSDERVREIVSFIRNPPLSPAMMPAYRILFAGAVASIPREYRVLLGLRRPLFPAVTATRLLLAAVRRILGRSSTSEEAALRRIARIRASV